MNHTINPPALFKLAKTSSREGFKKDQAERAQRETKRSRNHKQVVSYCKVG